MFRSNQLTRFFGARSRLFLCAAAAATAEVAPQQEQQQQANIATGAAAAAAAAAAANNVLASNACLELVRLSDDAIAVRGVARLPSATVPHRPTFRALHGRFSPAIDDPVTGATFKGWCFGNEKQAELENYLSSMAAAKLSQGQQEQQQQRAAARGAPAGPGDLEADSTAAGAPATQFAMIRSADQRLELLPYNGKFVCVRGARAGGHETATRDFRHELRELGGFYAPTLRDPATQQPFQGWLVPVERFGTVAEFVKKIGGAADVASVDGGAAVEERDPVFEDPTEDALERDLDRMMMDEIETK